MAWPAVTRDSVLARGTVEIRDRDRVLGRITGLDLKRRAVVFDRDGTLASCQREHVEGPSPDWGQFNSWIRFDAPVPAVANLFRLLGEIEGLTRIITTGREGTQPNRLAMHDWLIKHELVPDILLMRAAGDKRRDSVVKREMYFNHISPVFEVLVVVDDRPQVCDEWRSLGLPLVQVTDPGIIPPIARQTD